MWIRFVSLALLLSLSGCSVLGSKPKLRDSQAARAPISEELSTIYSQGLKLLQQQQYSEALEHWQKMSEVWPDYPGIWSNLALAQLALELYAEAFTSNEQALTINSNFCPALSLSGLLLREQGQFKQAIESYQQAIDCDPKNPDNLFNLGILYDLYLQDLGQALNYYEQAQSLLGEQDSNLAMWVEDLRNRQPARIAGEAE